MKLTLLIGLLLFTGAANSVPVREEDGKPLNISGTDKMPVLGTEVEGTPEDKEDMPEGEEKIVTLEGLDKVQEGDTGMLIVHTMDL